MNLLAYGALLTVLGFFVVAGLMLFITFAPLLLLIAVFGCLLTFIAVYWNDDDDPPYPGVAPSGVRLK